MVKKILNHAIVVVFIAAIICAVLGIRGCQHNAALVDEHKSIMQMQADTITYYRDHAGREHAMRLSAEASLSIVKLHYGKTIDSLAKALSIKPKQIERIVSVGTQTKGEVQIQIDTLYAVDSIERYHFRYNDNWLYMDGVFDSDLYVNYLFTDSIILTEFWKRHGLFGRKQYYIDGYSLNPNTHFTGLSSVKVGKKIPGRVGIGPYVGYGWDGNRLGLSVGVAAHYSIIRF